MDYEMAEWMEREKKKIEEREKREEEEFKEVLIRALAEFGPYTGNNRVLLAHVVAKVYHSGLRKKDLLYKVREILRDDGYSIPFKVYRRDNYGA